VALECDECGVLVAPNPDIRNSGWMKCGYAYDGGERFEWEYCPEHAHLADRFSGGTP
jgi:hypothetical protein